MRSSRMASIVGAFGRTMYATACGQHAEYERVSMRTAEHPQSKCRCNRPLPPCGVFYVQWEASLARIMLGSSPHCMRGLVQQQTAQTVG